MATPPSDDTKMLFKLLADGQWHDYHKIKASIANAVPPGRAIRRYQDRLRQSRELRSRPDTEILRDEDEQIRLGAMSAAQVALTSWKGKGIMVRGEGNFKEVRMKPGFVVPWITNPEAGREGQDPGKDGGGSPEVPGSDSVPSEARAATGNEPSDPQQVPEVATEPAAEPEPEVVVEHYTVELGPQPTGEQVPTFTTDEVFGDEPAIQPPPEQSQPVTNYEISACPECGMAIIDPALHEGWHADLEKVLKAPGSTFIDRETLATTVEGAIRPILLHFQAGLQRFLGEELAQLSQQIRALEKPGHPAAPWI